MAEIQSELTPRRQDATDHFTLFKYFLKQEYSFDITFLIIFLSFYAYVNERLP